MGSDLIGYVSSREICEHRRLSVRVERYLKVLQSARVQRSLSPGTPPSELGSCDHGRLDLRWMRLRFATARQGCNPECNAPLFRGGRVTGELSPDLALILDVQPQPAVAVEQVPWGV